MLLRWRVASVVLFLAASFLSAGEVVVVQDVRAQVTGIYIPKVAEHSPLRFAALDLAYAIEGRAAPSYR